MIVLDNVALIDFEYRGHSLLFRISWLAFGHIERLGIF